MISNKRLSQDAISQDEIVKAHFIDPENSERPLAIVDLNQLERQKRLWQQHLPDVTPHYAVKCNPDPRILQMLGPHFDCATENELNLVESLYRGNLKHHIIFAHPIKTRKAIARAKELGVLRMTFDSEAELKKIYEHYPEAEIILRLKPITSSDSGDALIPLGDKFGCDETEAKRLITLAVINRMKIIGTSFHCGSGVQHPNIFARTIQLCREIWDWTWNRYSIQLHLLDIGGGFPGFDYELFSKIAVNINESLKVNRFLSSSKEIEIIAEPGRFFVASSCTLFVQIHGLKKSVNSDRSIVYNYYLNDGIYGNLNGIVNDGYRLKLRPYNRVPKDPKGHVATFWGPTCDSFDCLAKDLHFDHRPFSVGDWLILDNMGAYTFCSATDFNSIPKVQIRYL